MFFLAELFNIRAVAYSHLQGSMTSRTPVAQTYNSSMYPTRTLQSTSTLTYDTTEHQTMLLIHKTVC